MDPNSDSQDIVDTAATENTGAASQETQEQVVVGEHGHGEAVAVENTDADNAGDDEPKADPEPPKRNRAQERIQQLAREKAELARELESYKSKKDEAQTLERPKIESFETYDEYEEAVDAYRIAKAEQNVLSKLEKDKTEKSHAQQQAEFESAVVELQEDGIDTQSLFKKAETLPPLPIQLDQFGLSAKETLKLAADLLQDDDLYIELSQMNPVQAAARIGRMIESAPTKPTAPKIPNAPKPIKPTSANAPVKRDTATMSDDEFLRSRGL